MELCGQIGHARPAGNAGTDMNIQGVGTMRVKVGPARRPGNTTTIYDGALDNAEITEDKGGVQLSFDALGIRCDKSLYRYSVKLSSEDLAKIVAVAKRAGAAIGAVFLFVHGRLSDGMPLIA
jgi:hypothetical protein